MGQSSEGDRRLSVESVLVSTLKKHGQIPRLSRSRLETKAERGWFRGQMATPLQHLGETLFNKDLVSAGGLKRAGGPKKP